MSTGPTRETTTHETPAREAPPRGPSVSVIVLTLDRVASLVNVLESLRWQTYTQFEVVVVVGPCTDGTIAALEPYADELVVVHNPERNISMSRNLGASAATGEILAFLDDDEIPWPTWLHDLVAGLKSDDSLGAVGGAVYGPNGRDLDWLYCSADLYGTAHLSTVGPTHMVPLDLDDPARQRIQYFPGGNNAFRRAAFDAVGGFDEGYTYYLDETDMFVRMHQSGWGLRQLTNAGIQHLLLQGIARDNTQQRTTNWIVILSSRVRFAIKHALRLAGPERVIDELSEWAPHVRNAIGDGPVLSEFNAHFEAGIQSIRDASAQPTTPEEPSTASHYVARVHEASEQRLFGVRATPASAHVVVATGLAPNAADMLEVVQSARQMVALGHWTRIIRPGNESVTRWADGLWIHELEWTYDEVVWAATVRAELDEIHAQQPINVVMTDQALASGESWVHLPLAGTEPTPAVPAAMRTTSPRSLVKQVATSPRLVIAQLVGGAGNELFQLAAALSITSAANVRTVANAATHLLSASDLLPGFEVSATELELELMGLRDPAMTSQTRLRKRLVMAAAAPMHRRTSERTVNQHGLLAMAFAAPPPGAKQARVLDGYFQHPGWYRPGDQVILEALLQRSPAEWAQFASSQRYNVVCFRQGDYVPLGWALPAEYYDEAMPLIGNELPLAVVGDDLAFNARMVAQYRERGNRIMRPPRLCDKPPINDFWVLAGATNIVMANSTFCWWATRVGDSFREKSHTPRIVASPRSWIAGVPHQMIEPSWTPVDDTLELLRPDPTAQRSTGQHRP